MISLAIFPREMAYYQNTFIVDISYEIRKTGGTRGKLEKKAAIRGPKPPRSGAMPLFLDGSTT
jgi:hypothetical protein